MGLERIGFDGFLYLNTGNYATPTWTEIDIVRDVTTYLEAADAPSRRSIWKLHLRGMLDASVEFQVVHDPADSGYQTIRDAFFNGNTFEVAVADEDITANNTEYFRMFVQTHKFTRGEPLEG